MKNLLHIDIMVCSEYLTRLYGIIAGLLTIGPRFGGAIDDAARYFKDAYDRVSHFISFLFCHPMFYMLFNQLNRSVSIACRVSHLMSLLRA